MNHSRLREFALPCVFLAAFSRAAVAEWEIVGRGFAEDPRLPALVRVLVAERDAALERFARRYGVAPRRGELRWLLDVSPGGGENHGRTAAWLEHGRIELRDERIFVTLPVHRFLAEPERARAAVAHEVGHAALAAALRPPARYFSLPRWFREGFALDFAAEGDVALRDEVAAAMFARRDPALLATGVLAAGDAPRSAAESYLAVDWLLGAARAAGEPTPWRPLVERLAAGETLEAAAARLTGAPWPELARAAFASTRARLAGVVPEERARAFRRSLDLRMRGDLAGAAAIWRELLAASGEDALATTLLYLLARAELESGTAPDGTGAPCRRLARLLGGPGELWRAEALVLLGDCARASGDLEAARRHWQQVGEAYPDDIVAARLARERLAEIAPPTGTRSGETSRVPGSAPR